MADLDKSAAGVANSALKGIPFGTLIGAPLQAAVEAQALAAKTSYDFIDKVGLNAKTDENGNVTRQAVNVDFKYMRGGELVTLNVPLITILQVPYFEINTLNIDFKAKISAEASTVQETSESSEKEGDANASVGATWGWFGARADFNASYSSKKDSYASSDSKYSVEYTMDIAVRAGQGDMPAGMATVLNILQGSIQEDSSGGITIQFKDGSSYTVADAKAADKIIVYVLEKGKVLNKGDVHMRINPSHASKNYAKIETAEHNLTSGVGVKIKLSDVDDKVDGKKLKAGQTIKLDLSKDANFTEVTSFNITLK